MKSFQSLILALLAIIVISAPVVADSATQQSSQLEQIEADNDEQRKLFLGLGKSTVASMQKE